MIIQFSVDCSVDSIFVVVEQLRTICGKIVNGQTDMSQCYAALKFNTFDHLTR